MHLSFTLLHLLFYIFCASFISTVSSNACTEACDALFPISLDMVKICGTDGEDHTLPVLALVSFEPPWSCYRDCGVGVLYPGTCSCPNDCYANSTKGKCGSSGCLCNAGWGGLDCSAVVCPNSCSNNGKCISNNGQDACMCNDGFTGADCSITELNIPTLPYGEIFPGNYYFNDSYGDNHPVFNLSIIGNFNMEMDPSDYNSMLSPVNTWNQSYYHANGTFSNGNVNAVFPKAGIKIKGNHARICAKKSFIIEFERKNKESFIFFGLSEIALKAPSFDLSYVHNQIIVEFYRAMMVPTSRGSFGTLTINGVFWGLYWLNEEIDYSFGLSRYGSDQGNMYQLNTYLVNMGGNGSVYANATVGYNGGILPAYKEQFGDGTYSDFAELAQFLNETSDTEFQAQIEQKFNVDQFIRSMIVESAVDIVDGYTHTGNNWALFDCPVNNSWQFITHDFEWTMYDPLQNAYDSVSDNKKTLLAYRILTIEQYHNKFTEYYKMFLPKVFDPSLSNSAKSRISAMEPFLRGLIEQDIFYTITNGFMSDEETWKLAMDAASEFLSLRYDFLNIEFLV